MTRCTRSSGRPAPSHVAAGRPPGPEAYRVRRLARRCGPVVVADAAARPAGRARLAVPSRVGLRRWPALLADPDAPVGARRASRRSSRATPSGRRLGGVRRRGRARRPGSLRARVDGAARVRGRARRAADRRPADLRRPGRRRPPRASRALPRRRRRRRAARRVERDTGQLWGNPLYDWPAMRAAATAGGSSASAHVRARSTSRASTTSAASSPTGRCRRARRAQRALAPRARARAVRRGRARELGDAAAIAEDLGVITPAGRPAARRARAARAWSCCTSPSTPATPRPRTASSTTRPIASSTPAPTTPTRSPVERDDAPPRAAPRPRRLGMTEWWMASRAPLVMLQAQDLLELGSEARMSTPGRATGNWLRLPAGALTPALARRLRRSPPLLGGVDVGRGAGALSSALGSGFFATCRCGKERPDPVVRAANC